jgi:hypothetical protein
MTSNKPPAFFVGEYLALDFLCIARVGHIDRGVSDRSTQNDSDVSGEFMVRAVSLPPNPVAPGEIRGGSPEMLSTLESFQKKLLTWSQMKITILSIDLVDNAR